jgi:hypothetical protein
MYEAFCDRCYASFLVTDEELYHSFFCAPHATCPHCGSVCSELMDDYEKPGVGMLEYDEETDLESEPDPDEGDGDSGGEEAEE